VFEDRLIGKTLQSIFNGLVAGDLIAVSGDYNSALVFPESARSA
jgi:hypothetical protein